MTLDHAGIAARIPHAGAMCLLDAMLEVDADSIRCRVGAHDDARHPLRTASGLLAAAAIEFAAQATALHGALAAPADRPRQRPGFVASARGVRLLVERLDDCPGPLVVTARRVASTGHEALYAFDLRDARAALLATGRVAVVLDAPLTAGLA